MVKKIEYINFAKDWTTTIFGIINDEMYVKFDGHYTYDKDSILQFAKECGCTLDSIQRDLDQVEDEEDEENEEEEEEEVLKDQEEEYPCDEVDWMMRNEDESKNEYIERLEKENDGLRNKCSELRNECSEWGIKYSDLEIELREYGIEYSNLEIKYSNLEIEYSNLEIKSSKMKNEILDARDAIIDYFNISEDQVVAAGWTRIE